MPILRWGEFIRRQTHAEWFVTDFEAPSSTPFRSIVSTISTHIQARRQGWQRVVLVFFFFCLSAQSRMVMMIIPLRPYPIMVIILREKNVSGVHPPSTLSTFCRAAAVLSKTFCHSTPPPPPSKHPGATHPLLPPQGISIARQRYDMATDLHQWDSCPLTKF